MGYQPMPYQSLGAKSKIEKSAGLSSASCPERNRPAGSRNGGGPGSCSAAPLGDSGDAARRVHRPVTRSVSRSVSEVDVPLASTTTTQTTQTLTLALPVAVRSTRSSSDSEVFVRQVGPRTEENSSSVSEAGPASAEIGGGVDGRARNTRRKKLSSTKPAESSDFGATGSSNMDHACVECGRSFSSKIGLSQHRRIAHRLEYEADVNLEKKKARWTKEEVRLLAMKEAELLKNGLSGINERLNEFMPSRSVDAIKSRRRYPEYKKLVQEYLTAPDSQLEQSMTDAVRVTTCVSRDLISPFMEVIEGIANNNSTSFKEDMLNRIWARIEVLTPRQISDELSMFLMEVFPDRPARPARDRQNMDQAKKTKKQIRHDNYKKTQRLYKMNRSRCIQSILSPTSVNESLSSQEVFRFWRLIMEEKSKVPTDLIEYFEPASRNPMTDIWTPVTCEEIKRTKFKKNTSPGPDGLTAEEYNSIPVSVLCKIFNIFMILGEVPDRLLRARTIFIPKKDGVDSPGELRPISISSVLLRAFHKVLAFRLQTSIKLDKRQRGFLSEDGCAQNVFLLDLLLKHQREKLQDLFMASIDVHKAFDSLSHEAIFAAASAHGLPPQFVTYLRHLYSNSTTILIFGSSTSSTFLPSRGVRQGDPLSPLLFNMVVDRLFRDLPTEVGIDIADVRINSLAYADDLVLAASTSKGLQILLDKLQKFLRYCSLTPNVGKSFTISLRTPAKEKKIVTDPTTYFTLDGQRLRPLTAIDTFTYLGVQFTTQGRAKITKVNLCDLLNRLRRGPLKPQQRLFALKHYVIPKFYHLFTLGKLYIGFLRQMDMIIRTEVRRWLNLPHDSPVAYFYASVNDGGLGIPCLRWMIPLFKVNRLERVRDEYLQFDNQYIHKEITFAKRFLIYESMSIKKKEQVALLWRKKLHKSVDGAYLESSPKVPGQHVWVGDGSSFLTSKDYINCIRLRINALPVRSRTTRGRGNLDRQCRAGCLSPETLNHVLQDCHRTQASRIARHDALLDSFERSLAARTHVVIREPRFQTAEGPRKPDIVAVRDQDVFVIDAQVVGSRDLDRANKDKVNKYRCNATLHEKIKDRFNSDRITYLALTISNRGVWSRTSANELIRNRLLLKRELKILSTRALIGGFAAFRVHGSRTSMRWLE